MSLTRWQASILDQARFAADMRGRATIGVCTNPHCCSEGPGHWVYAPDTSAYDPETGEGGGERKTFTIYRPKQEE
jgi:hypothetical protein